MYPPQANKDEVLTAKYRAYITQIGKLVVEKTDYATANMLGHVDQCAPLLLHHRIAQS